MLGKQGEMSCSVVTVQAWRSPRSFTCRLRHQPWSRCLRRCWSSWILCPDLQKKPQKTQAKICSTVTALIFLSSPSLIVRTYSLNKSSLTLKFLVILSASECCLDIEEVEKLGILIFATPCQRKSFHSCLRVSLEMFQIMPSGSQCVL